MTLIEKKNQIKKIIDALPEQNLEEVFDLIKDYTTKADKREQFIDKLLEDEKELFLKLAQ